MRNNNLIIITLGDPAGIGPDICLDLVKLEQNILRRLVVIGDVELLQERAELLGKAVELRQLNTIDDVKNINLKINQLMVLHKVCPDKNTVGVLKPENSDYVLNLLDSAIAICKSGISNIIVTAPISKEVINTSGVDFSGHTEYFAKAFNCKKVVMMLSNATMKVALLTTHVPLKDIFKNVTRDNLIQTLNIIIKDFTTKFNIDNPKIAVCGLNPHAGEGGYLGLEEIEIINPVIQEFQNKGYHVSGSYPADTIFNRANDFAVILAIYHDQGLPVLKYSGFDEGVNITLGLPIIRTSVDHGTAIELAGTGLASSSSLLNAVNCAISLDN
ncbi:MAG: 4-hydroxythreonine-4-phosphate dehydrogenase PdxA [Burkholderiales bacterium]|nr:4-hydroxythreonine-4-phosphate dehydrogenase PdxA [Burkholderiales bacterium]